MKLSGLVVVLVVFPVVLISSWHCEAGDQKAFLKKDVSPHSDSGACGQCHVAASETLNSWFVFRSTKRQMKDGLVEVCKKCHGSNFGHGIGKRPVVNHAELPLDDDGAITCATTCHSMHIRAEDSKQTFYHLRLPFDSLCISCHDN